MSTASELMSACVLHGFFQGIYHFEYRGAVLSFKCPAPLNDLNKGYLCWTSRFEEGDIDFLSDAIPYS
jgi:hypothetical protein